MSICCSIVHKSCENALNSQLATLASKLVRERARERASLYGSFDYALFACGRTCKSSTARLSAIGKAVHASFAQFRIYWPCAERIVCCQSNINLLICIILCSNLFELS